MEKICRKPVTLFLLLVIILSSLSACNVKSTETRKTIFNQYYAIEPKTLLKSIEENNSKPFSPIDARPNSLPSSEQSVVNWSLANYLQIANAVFDYIWDDSLNQWQISLASFSLGCENINTGFQNGIFEFYKVVISSENESRVTRYIDIDPRNNFIYVWETEYYPKLIDWESIDVEKIPITPETALHIAENSGGQEKRISVNNECDISISISPSSVEYNGWLVLYTPSNGGQHIFRLEIDPISGSHE